VHRKPPELISLEPGRVNSFVSVRSRLARHWGGVEVHRERLDDLTVHIGDDVSGIGVYADTTQPAAVSPTFTLPPGSSQFSVSDRRTISNRPSRLRTAANTIGHTEFARGAFGSW
jgi:hypothetical protein